MSSILISNSGLEFSGRLDRELALTIGNFDGLHRGHQHLIAKALEISTDSGLDSAILTFDPHPECLFDKSPRCHLFSQNQRIRALKESGVTLVIIQNFDPQFAAQSVEDFLRGYLSQQLRARAIIVGSDFRFARERTGNIQEILNFGDKNGIRVESIPNIAINGIPARSSTIRQLMTDSGNIRTANELLGHKYMLEGKIVRGDQRGRLIGFPTLNLEHNGQILPKVGVYFGKFILGDDSVDEFTVLNVPGAAVACVVNIGTRPTFKGETLKVEVHAIDRLLPMDSLYGSFAGVYFEGRIRDEQRFPTIEALKDAIKRDIDVARNALD